jgi:hypothetical protein
MGSNMKLAAERLIKIANDLEKEAADNTFFVCDGCNHTSSLLDINAKRKIAGKKHSVVHIANVTVNDAVTCLACGGKMSYVPTDTSEKYYVEAEDTEDTGADIFEPVDDQGADKGDETSDIVKPETAEVPVVDETPEDIKPVSEIPETDETPDEDKSEDTTEIVDYDGNPDEEQKSEDSETTEAPEDVEAPEISTEDEIAETPETLETPEDGETPEAPEIPVEEETPGDDNVPADQGTVEGEPVVEETVPEEEPAGEEGYGEEEGPVQEKGVEIPKKNVPKFEKIPKEAQDAFWRSVAKYSV